MGLKDIFSSNTEASEKSTGLPIDQGSVSNSEDLNSEKNDYPVTEIKEETPREALTPEEAQEISPLYSDVVLALKQVYDPEIPVNIYDLGLIYDLYIGKGHNVEIKMTFTAPNCPMADDVLQEVKTSVEDVPGVSSCRIDLVFDPVWDQSMLSDEARVDLGLD